MFMTAAFLGMTSMNVAIPVLFRERAVFYRERFSYMYGPEAYGMAGIIIELPCTLLSLTMCPCDPVANCRTAALLMSHKFMLCKAGW